MNNKSSWADEEFSEIQFGDKRLKDRLVKVCKSFIGAPESSINQACNGWPETKAAYRFFANDKVDAKTIIKSHCIKTTERANSHKTILAIQDTSYMIYTNHGATEGLGNISVKEGKNVKQIHSKGLVSHSCLAISTDGLPLGILDQKTYARKLSSEDEKKRKDVTAVEEKESYRWLEMLRSASINLPNTRVVTVCDREADMYDFFKLSQDLNSPVLVRARVNRAVNKKSRYAEKGVEKLWDFMKSRKKSGSLLVEVPSKKSKRNGIDQAPRRAKLGLKFGKFIFTPPVNNLKHRTETLPNIEMYGVYAYENNPPKGLPPLTWLLLTNIPVYNTEDAKEKIRWYCLRWRIETYFKVLKSGLKIEDCRLGHANRLIKYIAVMSVVAWRLFMLTLISRTNPGMPCDEVLDKQQEWDILYSLTHKGKSPPKTAPSMVNATKWIAKLGGHLGRRCDGPPGIITMWRGWKRLNDITRGWHLAKSQETYG